MGREIRKVPKNWNHPKNEEGRFIPLGDQSFDEAFVEWQEGLKKWIAGEDPDADKYGYPKTAAGWTRWRGQSPDPETYREVKWAEEEACCFQMYENVSEGTPVSPVFESLKGLEDWLVSQGHSRSAAQKFCESGYAPSMTFGPGGFKMGVDTFDM